MQQKRIVQYSVAGGILLILVIWFSSAYSSFVKKDEYVNRQWSEVQSTYQMRTDLIPQIVSVVKGFTGFESTTLEKVTAARSNAAKVLLVDSSSTEMYLEKQRLQDSLATNFNRMIARVEEYPELKATEAFSRLQTQLSGIERRIKVARKDFNNAVADYNKKVRTFPSNIVAGLFGFKKKEGFVADSGADKAIEINFTTK